MNSFEMDIKRAVKSRGFFAGLLLELVILFSAGPDSDLFRMSVPVLCTFPYSAAWLMDYQSGFLKFYLPRTSAASYIMGKILACGLSGGALEALGGWLYLMISHEEESGTRPGLLFLSGMLWAVLSALLAAASDSRYLAYGGSFVIYYLLVILCERYFPGLYCLCPYEWLKPEHIWVFDRQGVRLLLGGITLILICLYAEVVRYKLDKI